MSPFGETRTDRRAQRIVRPSPKLTLAARVCSIPTRRRLLPALSSVVSQMNRTLFGLVLILSGCAEGRDLSFDEAQAYFRNHSEGLRQVIELVERCKPVYPNAGYNAIRLNDPTDSNPACADGGQARLDEIKSALRSLQLLGADITLSTQGKAATADFWLYSAGLVPSGVSVSIIFHADLDTEKGAALKAIEPNPAHWFWLRYVS